MLSRRSFQVYISEDFETIGILFRGCGTHESDPVTEMDLESLERGYKMNGQYARKGPITDDWGNILYIYQR